MRTHNSKMQVNNHELDDQEPEKLHEPNTSELDSDDDDLFTDVNEINFRIASRNKNER